MLIKDKLRTDKNLCIATVEEIKELENIAIKFGIIIEAWLSLSSIKIKDIKTITFGKIDMFDRLEKLSGKPWKELKEGLND